ncbi:TPA: transcriptional regulator, partial [Vibrio cholerae]|nr:transcriptional regulator [Vibrio cholerae]
TVFYTLSSTEVKAMIELLHRLYCQANQ